jgi:hypothetical protein
VVLEVFVRHFSLPTILAPFSFASIFSPGKVSDMPFIFLVEKRPGAEESLSPYSMPIPLG